MNSNRLLCVISCGKSKIWDRHHDEGLVQAADAYVGAFFKCNKEYAVKFHNNNWLILSAKYGFIKPTTLIGNYNAKFKSSKISPEQQKHFFDQVSILIEDHRRVLVLGGKVYVSICRSIFKEFGIEVEAPLIGLKGNGFMQQAVKQAIRENRQFTLKGDGSNGL